MMAPSPSTAASLDCARWVAEALPVARAAPVLISAAPSDSLPTDAPFDPMADRAASEDPTGELATIATWAPRIAVLTEALPSAAFTPVLATPRPMLATTATCGVTTRPNPSMDALPV
jgi:hypothetical protein